MKVRCRHGYFFFNETRVGELSDFISMYGLGIEPIDQYYTFSQLLLAPDYSFANLKYIDDAAIAEWTFEGTPWDVMRKNKLVYDFNTGKVRPILSITARLSVNDSGDYFYSDGLILPGSINKSGQRVTDYSGFFPADGSKFRYTEIQYDQNI